MWTRRPLADAGDARGTALFDEVHRLLSRALPASTRPRLPVAGLGRAGRASPAIDDPMARQVLSRAATRRRGRGADRLPRAAPVTIRHEGWALEIPGSFAERRTGRGVVGRRRRPEHHAGRGHDRDGGRTRWPARPSSSSSAATSGRRRSTIGPAASSVGRSWSTDASSGVEVGVLEGYSAVVGSGRRDQDRVRRSGRLAVGARHLAVARSGLERPRGAGMIASMYVPAHFKPDDDAVRELLRTSARPT